MDKWYEDKWFGSDDYEFRGKDNLYHRPTEYKSEEEMLANMIVPYCFDYVGEKNSINPKGAEEIRQIVGDERFQQMIEKGTIKVQGATCLTN